MTAIDSRALPTRRCPAARIEHSIPDGAAMIAALADSVGQLDRDLTMVWMPDTVLNLPAARTNSAAPTAEDAQAFSSPMLDPRLWVPDRMKGSLAPWVRVDPATRMAHAPHPNLTGLSGLGDPFDEAMWRRDGNRVNQQLAQPLSWVPPVPGRGDAAPPAYGAGPVRGPAGSPPSVMSLPAQDWRTAPELSRAHQVMAHQQARAAMGARLAERATSSGKQLETAYLLWALLGHLGGHHFYLHRLATGALYTVLSVVGWVSFYQGLGVTFLVPVWLGLGVDLLLIPTYRARARHSIWSVG